MTKTICTAILVMLVAGCEGMDADDTGLTETDVIFHDDGTAPDIIVHTIPRDAAIYGSTCALIRLTSHYPDMSISDSAGNQACFSGLGTIDLNTVPRAGGTTWAYATYSYTPGSWWGSFGGVLWYSGRLHPCSESFAATRMTLWQAGQCAQNSNYLTLTQQQYLP